MMAVLFAPANGSSQRPAGIKSSNGLQYRADFELAHRWKEISNSKDPESVDRGSIKGAS